MSGIEGINELKDGSGSDMSEEEWKAEAPKAEEIQIDVGTGLDILEANKSEGATPEWDGRAVESEVKGIEKLAEALLPLETEEIHDEYPSDTEVLLPADLAWIEDGDPKLERMADVVHQVWANWMEYMFSKGLVLRDKGFKINPAEHGRWKRQMATPYAELSDDEKQSDRDIARRYLDLTIDFFLSEEPHV